MAFVGTTHTPAYAGNQYDSFLRTVTFGPYAAAALGDGNYPLFVLPDKASLVKITVRASAAGANSSDVFTFKKAAPGTAIASATAITDAVETNGLTADAAFDIPMDTVAAAASTAHQNLAAGTQISMTTGGTIASLAGLMIAITYRVGPFRRADGAAAGDGTGNVLMGG